jgi:lipocalin
MNGVCVYADYGLFTPNNGSVSVHNRLNVGNASGELEEIYGYAVPDGTGVPGHLTVTLGGAPFPAPYWVIVTGPVCQWRETTACWVDLLKLWIQIHWKLIFDSTLPCRLAVFVVFFDPSVADKYDYVIVTDQLQITMWVLVRNITAFEQKYEADVLAELQNLGFSSFWNSPIKTNQTGCIYAPTQEEHMEEGNFESSIF